MDDKLLLDTFIKQVIEQGNYTELDRNYLYNRILNLVGEGVEKLTTTKNEIIDLKDELVEYAVQHGKVGETLNEQDCLGAELMNFITPLPSKVNQDFWQTYQQNSPEEAIQNFYDLSKRNDYIKTKAIAKNIYFPVETSYGQLEITINLSKPEKDPKQIALAKKMKASGYPLCQLCMENEGYQGRVNYPARANHRIIRFDLDDKQWGFQYSPYAYFNEHCIFLDTIHEPMEITKQTFNNLLGIIEQFPGYFVGSNADLPIVGGSILTHEHYQGGRHTFAMEKAPIETELKFAGYEDIQAGIVKWPMSVIRLRGNSKEDLVDLADKILKTWHGYSDEEVSVLAESNGEKHHTITPIACKRDGQLELDLVLRDNQTSEQYPDGIYHPHPDVQHIKKENIGLIEVMGLAILPPRLKDELQEVEKYLLGQENKMEEYHQVWADDIKQKYSDIGQDNVGTIIQQELGRVFARVLEDAGVYKHDETGRMAFKRFVEEVGIVD